MGMSQYIVLQVGMERYGVELKQVVSVDTVLHITSVPNTLSFLKGVSHLRGVLTHIVDLQERVGDLRHVEGPVEGRSVVVVDAHGLTIGLTVDGVNEVTDIDDEWIVPVPATFTGKQSTFLQGVAKLDGDLLVLLDLEHILSDFELLQLQEITSQLDQ